MNDANELFVEEEIVSGALTLGPIPGRKSGPTRKAPPKLLSKNGIKPQDVMEVIAVL